MHKKPLAIMKQRRVVFMMPSGLRLLLDIVKYRVNAAEHAQGMRRSTQDQLLGAIVYAYILDNKQSILDALGQDVDRKLVEATILTCRQQPESLRFGQRHYHSTVTGAQRRRALAALVRRAAPSDAAPTLPAQTPDPSLPRPGDDWREF